MGKRKRYADSTLRRLGAGTWIAEDFPYVPLLVMPGILVMPYLDGWVLTDAY